MKNEVDFKVMEEVVLKMFDAEKLLVVALGKDNLIRVTRIGPIENLEGIGLAEVGRATLMHCLKTKGKSDEKNG